VVVSLADDLVVVRSDGSARVLRTTDLQSLPEVLPVLAPSAIRSSCRYPVVMMQATEHRDGDDGTASGGRFALPRNGNLLGDPLMRACGARLDASAPRQTESVHTRFATSGRLGGSKRLQ
jgi:hypothetical protein